MLWGDGWSYLNKVEGFTQPLPSQPAVLIRAWITPTSPKSVHQFCASFPPKKKNTNSSPSLNFQSNQSTSKRKNAHKTSHGTWKKNAHQNHHHPNQLIYLQIQVAVVMVHPPKRCWWHPAHPTHQQHEALNLPTNETCSNQHRAIRLNTWKDDKGKQ